MLRPAPPQVRDNVTMSVSEASRTCQQAQSSQQPLKAAPKSYTVRVIFCVLFVFLTELFLAHYVYRLISSEIRSEYVAKQDFLQYFLNEIRSEHGRDEVLRIFQQEQAKEAVPGSGRSKRSSGDYAEFEGDGDVPPKCISN